MSEEMEVYNEKEKQWLDGLKSSGFNNETEVVIHESGEPQWEKLVKFHRCVVPKVPIDKGAVWRCPCGMRWRCIRANARLGKYGDPFIETVWRHGYLMPKTQTHTIEIR